LSDSVAGNNLGVRSALRERDPAYVLATDKNSPYANEEGLIAAPNVDMGSELLAMKMAEIAYRANAAVIKTQLNNDKRLFDALR
jgi:flagellar basal-body rod protein FlgC